MVANILMLLRQRESCIRWCPENLEKMPARESRQQIDLEGEKQCRCDENDPAFEEMKRSVSHSRAPKVHGQTNYTDPEAIHCHGNGDARQQYQDALPDGSDEQISGQNAQAEKRKQITQSAACVDDLEFVVAQINQIAFQVDRNSEQPDEEDAQL